MTLLTPTLAAPAVSLREPRRTDADASGRIAYEAFRRINTAHGFRPDFPDPETAIGLLAALIDDPSVFGVVAEAGGRVVGSNFLLERDPVRGVGPITVDPAAQGAGIGRRLMQAVLDRAGPGARVRLVQAAFNTRSLALYATLGFRAKEPLMLVEGRPEAAVPAGLHVRPMTGADVPAATALCTAVHGIARAGELRDALRRFAPQAVERDGRITGYLTEPGLWLVNHGVAETEADMTALLAGAATAGRTLSLLLPIRQASLFRWCLDAGMRVVMPMTLMAIGDYQDPAGSWFPSVFY
ncbi:GNAT family N-acetyltransferase [Elioraea sp.]|uniref:GNAT family N-acetyltransferase n=1 Tax=Elioraea sp. TaxID=2185103 RepID=UPI003F72E155